MEKKKPVGLDDLDDESRRRLFEEAVALAMQSEGGTEIAGNRESQPQPNSQTAINKTASRSAEENNLGLKTGKLAQPADNIIETQPKVLSDNKHPASVETLENAEFIDDKGNPKLNLKELVDVLNKSE